MSRFLLGINYWPRSSAMYAWERFDLGEIREDMGRIAELGLDVVRFFLSWEAFSPNPETIDRRALQHVSATMDAIADAGLRAMPTLFCGHMSGVNWLPQWTLDPQTPHGRFRTIAGGRTSPHGIGDFYTDPYLLAAQLTFERWVADAIGGHPALWAWDLGNEFSNLREPATPRDAAEWSRRLCDVLRERSNGDVTGGMHAEDLERDRHIRPSSIAQPWSFASMHGYSVYSPFARGRLDTAVVPFLAQLQASCSGKRVLFTELGNPTCSPSIVSSYACLSEEEMALYAVTTIDRLHGCGALGAFWWCWADYDRALAELAPFDLAPHELSFGIVRSDGTFKPVAHALARIAVEKRSVVEAPPAIVDESAFYASLPRGIFDEYHTYCEQHG